MSSDVLEKRVLERIKEKDVVALTRQLVRIPSENPPGEEKAMAEFVAEKLSSLGFNVKLPKYKPGRPHVVGLFSDGKEKPSLMFNAHLDTVPIGDKSLWTVDPLGAEIRNGKIYGRGSSDMKAALAAMVSAAKAILEDDVKLTGTLMITGVTDEEVTGLGTKDIIDRGYRADFAIVGEPTELKVQTAHKGIIWLRIVTKGKAVHSSMPQEGVNAIYKMSKICLTFEDMLQQLMKKNHPLLGSPTISVGTIKGGLKINIVPDYCEISVDRRLVPGETPEVAKHEIKEVLATLKTRDPQLQLEVETINSAHPSETDATEPIVKVARESVKEITGKDPGITGFTATCDMRHLVKAKIPTIILGPGNLSQAHTIDEYIEIKQIVEAAKIYALMTLRLLC